MGKGDAHLPSFSQKSISSEESFPCSLQVGYDALWWNIIWWQKFFFKLHLNTKFSFSKQHWFPLKCFILFMFLNAHCQNQEQPAYISFLEWHRWMTKYFMEKFWAALNLAHEMNSHGKNLVILLVCNFSINFFLLFKNTWMYWKIIIYFKKNLSVFLDLELTFWPKLHLSE